MSCEVLTILSDVNHKEEDARIPIIGKRTLKLVESLNITQEGKETIISEASEIFSRCKYPGDTGSRTNIAVGYVQSGKTMSFTVLSALAADNGVKIIIYLTGTKTNLQLQTYRRLKDTFVKEGDFTSYQIFQDSLENTYTDINRIRNFLLLDDCVLMFPILKHHQHIETLASIFTSASIAPHLQGQSVLIIYDEADQSSFNTYAKKNTNKKDWEEDEFSSTYTSILNLRKAFPCHSYVQYTATPQAAFLIDSNDILSPEYHTVLTPGDNYTGGLFFFKNKERRYVVTIPEEEIYHAERNPLRVMPKSLENALKEFLVSVAVKVFIKHDVDFLSMMIHVDGSRASNEKFCKWTAAKLTTWIDRLAGNDSDPAKAMLLKSFKSAYDSITQYVESPPSFEEVSKHLKNVIILTHIRLVQGNGPSTYAIQEGEIDWSESPAHILVGADMLNRGFTVEKLSMTYMPRTTKGKSNADTIEQRCRFFGYKKQYVDVCRIYISHKSKSEYEDYVDHEEMLRKNLKQCKSIAEFSKMSNAMVLTNRLNPTRSNILSSKLVRNKMIGWRQLLSVDQLDLNRELVDRMLMSISADKFTLCKDYAGNVMRNHRYIDVEVDSFINFFKGIKYDDVPNITRKLVTIQYLRYLKEQGRINSVRLYEIAYSAVGDKMRSHQLHEGRPVNVMAGYAANGSYPGDGSFKSEETITFQIHRYRINSSGYLGNKVACNFTVHYPEKFAVDYITTNKEYDIEEDF